VGDREPAGQTPESPEVLRATAHGLDVEAMRVQFEPLRLRTEAFRLRATADLLVKRDEAAAAAEAAESAADRAAAEYEATAEPERVASNRAVEARQLFEAAFDAERQAVTRHAEPAELVACRQRSMAAGEVAEHEQAALDAARAARTAAAGRVEAARENALAAKERLAAAAAALDDPLNADADPAGRAWGLFLSWPARLVLRNEPGWQLSEADYVLCKGFAAMFAEEMGVGMTQGHDGALREVRKALGQTTISLVPGGAQLPVTSLLAGRS